MEVDGLHATVDHNFSCEKEVSINIEATDANTFKGNRIELQKLLGGVRAALGFECDSIIKRFNIIGKVGGEFVYQAYIQDQNNWRLTNEVLVEAKPVRQTTGIPSGNSSSRLSTPEIDRSSQRSATPMSRISEPLSEIMTFHQLGLTAKTKTMSRQHIQTNPGTRNGVQVIKILEGGAADKVGIKSGDFIVAVDPLPGTGEAKDIAITRVVPENGYIVDTTDDVKRNLESYQEEDLVYIRIKSYGKNQHGNHYWYEQHFTVRVEHIESTRTIAENYIDRPRTHKTGFTYYGPRSRLNESDPVYKAWYREFLKSERFKMLVRGDAYGKKEKVSLKDGFVDLESVFEISSVEGGQFKLYTGDKCRNGYDEVNLFVIASSPDNYINHRISLGTIMQQAKNRCKYTEKANIYFVEKTGKIREKFSILKGSRYIYKPPSNSSSVPELVNKGAYGPLFYNLSSGGLSAIYADEVSMVITRYIYSSFGFAVGQHCESVYGAPDVIKSTTIARNQYGVTGSSERNIEVAPRFAKGIERYQGRVTGMTSRWVSEAVNDFIKANSCKSKNVRNMYNALIEFEKNDYVK